MEATLTQLLAEMEEFGRSHDVWNITPDTGRFFNILIRTAHFRRVVEIGTSNGYSGIWMAEALSHTGGKLITLEADSGRHGLAQQNFERSGLRQWIDSRLVDARQALPALEGGIDLAFLDAWKADNLHYLELVLPKMRPSGLIVADNATSHPEEMRTYIERCRTHPRLDSVLLPIGHGEEVSRVKD